LEYHSRLLVKGIFFLPSNYGALCTAHGKAEVEKLFLETEEFAKDLKPSS
jgi:glutamate-1-semialdehyde aminotransferase